MPRTEQQLPSSNILSPEDSYEDPLINGDIAEIEAPVNNSHQVLCHNELSSGPGDTNVREANEESKHEMIDRTASDINDYV